MSLESLVSSEKLVLVPPNISEGNVFKLNLTPQDGEIARALHFLPAGSTINEHTHTLDSECYIDYSFADKSWIRFFPYSDIASPSLPNQSHGAKAKYPTLIFGAKRSTDKSTWKKNMHRYSSNALKEAVKIFPVMR